MKIHGILNSLWVRAHVTSFALLLAPYEPLLEWAGWRKNLEALPKNSAMIVLKINVAKYSLKIACWRFKF